MNKAQLWLSRKALTLLQGWARDGTEAGEIARRMGISPFTLLRWRRRYPPLEEALSQSREWADYLVEDALFRSAVGYRYTEEKREQTDKGEKLVSTEKEAGPNVSAISLWLKRRRPQVWGDAGEEAPEGENNLFQALGPWREEVMAADAVPELQSPAAADGDLVEDGAVPAL